MLSEVNRSVFLQLLQDWSVRRGGWTAVCVFIPPEHVHDHCAQAAEQLIDAARAALCEAPVDGIFARIGWTSYFAVTNSAGEVLCAALERVACPADASVHWHCAVKPIPADSDGLLQIFQALEVSAIETVRTPG